MNHRQCKTCMWYHPDSDHAHGTCRATPPHFTDNPVYGTWPRVFAYDWCKDYDYDVSKDPEVKP